MSRSLLAILSFFVLSLPAAASQLTPALEEIVEEAMESGLPTEPLALKAREGLAKGVSEDRVAHVLREHVGRLERARALIQGGTGPELQAGADALRAGASEAAIRALNAGDCCREQALQNLADLLYLGIAEADAVRLVVAARGQEGALTTLSPAAATLLAGGSAPDTVVRQVSAAVAEGRSPLAAIPSADRGPNELPSHANPHAHENRPKNANQGKGHNQGNKGNGSNKGNSGNNGHKGSSGNNGNGPDGNNGKGPNGNNGNGPKGGKR